MSVPAPALRRARVAAWLDAVKYPAALLLIEACGGDDQMHLVTYTPSRVVLRANTNCRGMLVLSDTAYPGWRAYVDGKRVPIHEVNFSMRGVVVPAGAHEVKFYYRPLAIYLGAGLSLLGLAAAAVIGIRDRKQVS